MRKKHESLRMRLGVCHVLRVVWLKTSWLRKGKKGATPGERGYCLGPFFPGSPQKKLSEPWMVFSLTRGVDCVCVCI